MLGDFFSSSLVSILGASHYSLSAPAHLVLPFKHSGPISHFTIHIDKRLKTIENEPRLDGGEEGKEELIKYTRIAGWNVECYFKWLLI